MKKNLNFSEWLGLVTSVSALYSYIYYYKYWRFFGINAYDYFSYIDAFTTFDTINHYGINPFSGVNFEFYVPYFF